MGDMHMKLRNLLSIIATMTLMSACGADPGKKNSEYSQKMQGIWESDCVNRVAEFGAGSMEDHAYSIRNWNFSSDKEFSYTEIHYSDAQCQTGNEAMTLSGSGTYELGDDLGTDTGKHIKFKYTDFSVIIKDKGLAEELTTAKYCGQTTWRFDETVSLYGKTCTDSDGISVVFPAAGINYADVVDINGNSMWMGKKDTPISSQGAEKIDADLTYRR